MLIAFILLVSIFTPASLFAEEVVVSHVQWIGPSPSLICELSSGPEHLMEGQLRCFEDLSNTGKPEKGKEVFTYRDEARSPISVSPALGTATDVLLTMWESGAYACYMPFGYHEGTIRKLFEQCTKGGIEILEDGKDGKIFMVSTYVPSAEGFVPTDTGIYHWSGGKLESKRVPWKERLNEIARMQRKP